MVVACFECKRFQIPGGEWVSPDRFLYNPLDAFISHGHCPDCVERLEEKSQLSFPER